MESTKSEQYEKRTKNVNSYFKTVRFIFDYLLYDFAGGPKKIKAAHVVTTVCLSLIPITLILKNYFQNDSFQSWWTTSIYFSYLFVWPMKGHFFPDESWEQKLTYLSAIIFACFNLAELSAGFYFVSGYKPHSYPLSDVVWLSLCTVIYVFGVLIFTLSDAQKYFILKNQQKRELFTDGFFKYIRHPNYLGQGLVYTSFMLMAYDWVPVIIYIPIFVFLFFTNMKIKEASMSRYPNWNAYKQKTGMLFPKIWS